MAKSNYTMSFSQLKNLKAMQTPFDNDCFEPGVLSFSILKGSYIEKKKGSYKILSLYKFNIILHQLPANPLTDLNLRTW